AEDGIRDRNVTGVQTCALPISLANQMEFRGQILPFIDDETEPPGFADRLPVHCIQNAGPVDNPVTQFRYHLPIVAVIQLPEPGKIGRASCRERVKRSEMDGKVK